MDTRLQQALELIESVTLDIYKLDNSYLKSITRQQTRVEEHVFNFDRYLENLKEVKANIDNQN